MNQALTTVAICLLLTLPAVSLDNAGAYSIEEQYEGAVATYLSQRQPEDEEQYALDADDAQHLLEHMRETTESPAEEAPLEPATEAPSEPATDAPTEASTDAPKEAATDAPTEASTEATTEPSTEATTEASTDAPTEPSVEAPTEPPAPTEQDQGPSADPHVMSLAGTGWHHHHHDAAPAPAGMAAGATEHAAKHAQEAAKVAKEAAVVANRVAEHSINITGHAKKALKHALGALHDARVDSVGLDKEQKHSLKKAEAHLREATKTADHGELKKLKDETDLQKEKMQARLDTSEAGKTEKEELREQVQELREKLKGKKHDKDLAKALEELKAKIDESDNDELDDLKAELERMRDVVNKLEDKAEKHDASKSLSKDIDLKPLDGDENDTLTKQEVTPVEEKGIDIDTQMPYGDLEPFGREDTAQELTESSIKESDNMVDQLERAEVAEEKRSVFRALTRLRGAAITSYDGVARSQSGNIDEYSKVHKFRKAHPLHHLADEESDVSKWAFPDNADLLQMSNVLPRA